MNKKGFTLVELLAVIAIMSVLISIAAISVVNIIARAKDNTAKEMRNDIIDAATTYAIMNKLKCPTLNFQDKCQVSEEQMNVKTLLDEELFENKGNKCNPDVKIVIYITESGDYEINVQDTDGNVCKG